MVRKFGSNKTIGALKVRGKVVEISFEAKSLRKAKKFVEIRLRYFWTILCVHRLLCIFPIQNKVKLLSLHVS